MFQLLNTPKLLKVSRGLGWLIFKTYYRVIKLLRNLTPLLGVMGAPYMTELCLKFHRKHAVILKLESF